MIYKMYQVDSFTEHLFKGNPAAVLILDEWLSDNSMQAIATENNLAETAFVKKDKRSWSIRWFTPTMEVDFCGHATLAAAHILVTEYFISGPLTFLARIGELKVEVLKNSYLLDLPCLPPEKLHQLPPVIKPLFNEIDICYFKNFENIFVVLSSEEAVKNYKPNHQILMELGSTGLVITAESRDYDFVSRYFAPGSGIPEDPVTGSIHATLVPFWAEKLNKYKLSAYQASPRGGNLICQLKANRVILEGKATTFMKAEIYLPD